MKKIPLSKPARALGTAAIIVAASLIPPMIVANPFADHSEFVQRCTDGEALFPTDAIIEWLWMAEADNPFLVRILVFAEEYARPLMLVHDRVLCTCFERGYSPINGPILYEEYWASWQALAIGDLDVVAKVFAPLDQASQSIQDEFALQTAAGTEILLACIQDEMDAIKAVSLPLHANAILAARLGLMK